jgi:hypothetical protein
LISHKSMAFKQVILLQKPSTIYYLFNQLNIGLHQLSIRLGRSSPRAGLLSNKQIAKRRVRCRWPYAKSV